jgi:hypothetical protein
MMMLSMLALISSPQVLAVTQTPLKPQSWLKQR